MLAATVASRGFFWMSWVQDWGPWVPLVGLDHIEWNRAHICRSPIFFWQFASTWNSNCNLFNFAYFSRGSQFHVYPLLLFTYAEGGITCVLNIIAHVDSSLHMIHLRGEWCAAQALQYPLTSSFTSGLPSNLASFPANKQQLAHSHILLLVSSSSRTTLPPPTHRPQLGFSNIPAGK